jgi:cysteinyl-tRNA synthetase
MVLHVYSTQSRRKESFQPTNAGRVGMYVCGPTVYKPSHVGHMAGPVIFDTVKRYLTCLGYQVTFVVNITDIDDKIIHEATNQKRDWKELAESVEADYLTNLKQLGVTGIDHFPRATEYIPGMIAMIEGLIEKGCAYAAGGDVYFDITRDDDYGRLCNRDPERLEAGARIEVSDKKRSPGDFALWKGAKPGEPQWDSPWGPGRPGWHIECSVMSTTLLGATLDFHGGGLDLQFPHHENELAQSESYTGKPFVRYWMHNGLMKTGDRKMSKSEGNEIVVTELLKRHAPETLRLLLLSSHYRSPIEYSEDRLREVRRSLEGFYRFFERYEQITGQSFYQLPVREGGESQFAAPLPESVPPLRDRFFEAMDDDFNTAGAAGALFELLSVLNRFADAAKLEAGAGPQAVEEFRAGARVLRQLSHILGLFWEPAARAEVSHDQLLGGLMQLLIDLRAEARRAKNFALADQIRKRLGELGVTLEDRPSGMAYRLQC